MTRKQKIMAGAGAAVIVAAGAFFLLKGNGGQRGGAGGPGGPGGMAQESSVSVVKAAVPEVGDLSLTTSLTGTVEASDVVYVYAKAAGDVTSVLVKAGEMVNQGDVLLEIDTEQVDSAKNSMESAQVSLEEAQSNLRRMQILYQGGDLSDQEYEQYTNAVKSAQLQYESAKLAYEKQVEYSTVTAPISGKIESCDVEVYDRVSSNEQLCVIAGEGESRITFYVTQRMMNNLSEGDTIEVGKNGVSYSGRITEISSMVDSDTGLFKVKAEAESADEIPIGSTVKLSLVTEKAEHAMLVPVDAIYYSNSDAYVYLYKDGYATMQQVEVGLYDSNYAEILSGLNADDIVVSTWSSNLYEGAEVRLYEEASESEAPADSQKDAAAAGGNGMQQHESETTAK